MEFALLKLLAQSFAKNSQRTIPGLATNVQHGGGDITDGRPSPTSIGGHHHQTTQLHAEIFVLARGEPIWEEHPGVFVFVFSDFVVVVWVFWCFVVVVFFTWVICLTFGDYD